MTTESKFVKISRNPHSTQTKLWYPYCYLSEDRACHSAYVTDRMWKEIFDIGIFLFFENSVFSDHKNTSPMEKFKPGVC